MAVGSLAVDAPAASAPEEVFWLELLQPRRLIPNRSASIRESVFFIIGYFLSFDLMRKVYLPLFKISLKNKKRIKNFLPAFPVLYP